ncbi:hypothetical protein FUAX_27070 [Fulvitalea axinellae]|uniref:Outer membrane protein beta-barrel domain-containing protein n=1 Tax=Fulvitalea axinellae TaxID=1182444 RepID=A0AAU9DCY0_9BACT|nr:hypothetical protein FUAX_27070 [Fulvitalea axinellae]
MKKMLFALALLFAFGFANAQDESSEEGNDSEHVNELKFGVRGAANLGTFALNEVYKGVSKWDWGFTVGVTAEKHFSPLFSVQAELLYSYQQAGVLGTFAPLGVRYENTIKTDFLNLPVMAKFYVFDGFYLDAGLQAGLKLDARQDLEQKGMGMSSSEESNIAKDFIDVTFDVVGGGGYLFDFGLFVDLRYQYGFLNMLRPGSRPENDTSLKRSSFALGIGYVF